MSIDNTSGSGGTPADSNSASTLLLDTIAFSVVTELWRGVLALQVLEEGIVAVHEQTTSSPATSARNTQFTLTPRFDSELDEGVPGGGANPAEDLGQHTVLTVLGERAKLERGEDADISNFPPGCADSRSYHGAWSSATSQVDRSDRCRR